MSGRDVAAGRRPRRTKMPQSRPLVPPAPQRAVSCADGRNGDSVAAARSSVQPTATRPAKSTGDKVTAPRAAVYPRRQSAGALEPGRRPPCFRVVQTPAITPVTADQLQHTAAVIRRPQPVADVGRGRCVRFCSVQCRDERQCRATHGQVENRPGARPPPGASRQSRPSSAPVASQSPKPPPQTPRRLPTSAPTAPQDAPTSSAASLDKQLRERLKQISLPRKDVGQNSEIVNRLGENVLRELKENSPSSLYRWEIMNSGSYYDKTKVWKHQLRILYITSIFT